MTNVSASVSRMYTPADCEWLFGSVIAGLATIVNSVTVTSSSSATTTTETETTKTTSSDAASVSSDDEEAKIGAK